MNDVQSGAELLAANKPRLRELATNICLRPDLLERWDTLNDALAEEKGNTTGGQRMANGGTTPAAKKLARQIKAVEKEIEDTQFRFLFRAMPKDQWQAIADQHPRREGNQLDAFVGYNRDAVVDEAIRGCLVSPRFNDCTIPDCSHVDCGSWQQFLSVCNPSEWAELRRTVDEVNQAATNAPKSQLASQILGSGGSGSKQRKRGA